VTDQSTVSSRERCLTLFFVLATLRRYFRHKSCLFVFETFKTNELSVVCVGKMSCCLWNVCVCSPGPFRQGSPTAIFKHPPPVTYSRSVFLKITPTQGNPHTHTLTSQWLSIQEEHSFSVLMHMNKRYAGPSV